MSGQHVVLQGCAAEKLQVVSFQVIVGLKSHLASWLVVRSLAIPQVHELNVKELQWRAYELCVLRPSFLHKGLGLQLFKLIHHILVRFL